MHTKKFWYVYCPNQRKPSHKHETLASAIIEVNRLAGICPERYEILECVAVVVSTAIKMDIDMQQTED